MQNVIIKIRGVNGEGEVAFNPSEWYNMSPIRKALAIHEKAKSITGGLPFGVIKETIIGIDTSNDEPAISSDSGFDIEFKRIGGDPLTIGDIYGNESDIVVIHSIDNGKHHLILSCNDRLPSYKEVKAARYQICPDIPYMAQVFPPKDEFVNLHPNVLHLWEIEQ